MRRQPRIDRLLPWLVLVALPLLAFGRLALAPGALVVDGERPSVDEERRWEIRSGQAIPIGNDLTRLFLPNFLRQSESVRRTGHIAGWDPFGFGGRPNIGNPQAGLFYPPIWVAWRIGEPSALGWLTVAHLIGAGFGSYRLARATGLGRGAATVAGGVYEVCPYLLAQAFEGHLPHVWAMAWAPWAFAAMIGFRRGERAGGLALPPILALCLLTGHPQEGYLLVVALGAWCLIDAFRDGREGRRRALWFGAILAATGGLLAIEWLPDLMARPWVLRSTRLSLRQAGQYHTGAWNLLQLLSPRALGGPADYIGPVSYWETVVSIGWIPLVLALVGAHRSPRRRLVRGWSALAGVSLVFAAGSMLGIFAMAYAILPGIPYFRVPARVLFLASLAGAQLAGLGWDVVRDAGIRFLAMPGRRAAAVSGAFLVVFFAGGWSVAGSIDGRWARAWSRLAADPIFVAALAATLAGLAIPGRRPRLRAGWFGAAALLELGLSGLMLVQVAPLDRFVRAERMLPDRPEEPPGPYRVRGKDAFYTDLQALAEGRQKTNIYDSFQLQHAADLYETLYILFEPRRPFDPDMPLDDAVDLHRAAIRQAVLDRLGVAWLITDHPEFRTDLPREDGPPGTVLYRNPTALPRAYVVPKAALLNTGEECPAAFLGVDPREMVLMTDDPLAGIPPGRQSFRAARYESPEPDLVVVEVETEAPGLLVIADTWMPGWTATLDGRPATIHRGDGMDRVVALEKAGAHRLEMRYDPPGWRAGVAITLATMASWGILGALGLRARPRGAGKV